MHRTLFFIPHEIAGIPVFGFGWLLGVIVIYAIASVVLARRNPEKGSELKGTLAVCGIAGFIVAKVFPGVEIRSIADEPIGMAVRGYGFMMLLGVLSGVILAIYRAKKYDINSDTILSAAPWLFILGILGARAFYVIEYRENFTAETLADTIRAIADFTRGGLVVYGSIIGGFIGLVAFCRLNKLPFLRIADIIIPCVFIGICFGRVGCLMNGCCYGGRCEPSAIALNFPKGSPVYDDQATSGDLVGIQATPEGKVRTVRPDSLADEQGITKGQKVSIQRIAPDPSIARTDLPVGDSRQLGVRVLADGKLYTWNADELPATALPVAPAQLFSSGSALIVALILLAISRFIKTEGVLLGIGFATYAVVRFGLEIIRSDEPGQFGTALTISQWVSICVFTASVGLIAYLLKNRKAKTPEPAA